MSRRYRDESEIELLGKVSDQIEAYKYSAEYKGGYVPDAATFVKKFCSSIIEDCMADFYATYKDPEFKAMNPQVWYKIGQMFVDRAAGKAATMIEVKGSDGNLARLNGQQLEQIWLEHKRLESGQE